jgi:hypothetical protein
MAEWKPCPVCGKRPELVVRKVDIPEADRLYPVAALKCDCKVAEAIALTDEEAIKFAEIIWNEEAIKRMNEFWKSQGAYETEGGKLYIDLEGGLRLVIFEGKIEGWYIP